MSDALKHAQYLEGFFVSEDVPAYKAREIAKELRSQAAEITRLRAALAAQGAQWLPIESAPKDGTSVLLCQAIRADGKPIDWGDDLHTAQVFVQVAAWWAGDDDWIVYCSQIAEPRLHFVPTHWMPLPAAPGASPQAPAGTRRHAGTGAERSS